ncbi:MAG: carbohydrate porin [Phycisphaerales bacterium]|nr:carbohydrate porin [Phycisphaerales bacterium]
MRHGLLLGLLGPLVLAATTLGVQDQSPESAEASKTTVADASPDVDSSSGDSEPAPSEVGHRLPPGQGRDLSISSTGEEIDTGQWGGRLIEQGHFIRMPHSGPVRQGHGGFEVYNRAGHRQHGVSLLPSMVKTVPGEQMPDVDPGRWGLLYGVRSDAQKRQQIAEEMSGWTGKGLRVVTDVHKLASVSEPLLDLDPMKPVNDVILAFRQQLLDPISTTFDPMMAWTYQHSTEVRPGYPSARSVLFFSVNGAVILWNDQDTSGRVVYNIQAQQGAFTGTQPYMGTAVGSPMLMNNILVSSDFNLYMLYWHQELFEKKVRVSIGKFEDQVFFDTNAIAYNPATQFMYEGFNQSITNPFPSYGFGGIVGWDVAPNWTLRAGTMNSESIGTSTGFEYLSSDHLFTMIESDFTTHFDWGEFTHEGHYRFMLWYNSIGQTASGNSPWDASGWGVTFNMDQRIWQGLVGFCRVGWGENDVTPSNFSVSAGFGIEDFLGRQGDCFGFAGSWSKLTELGRYGANLPLVPGNQTLFELFWRVNMTDSIQVSPVLQYVQDTGAGIDDAWIWGIRSVWSF